MPTHDLNHMVERLAEKFNVGARAKGYDRGGVWVEMNNDDFRFEADLGRELRYASVAESHWVRSVIEKHEPKGPLGDAIVLLVAPEHYVVDKAADEIVEVMLRRLPPASALPMVEPDETEKALRRMFHTGETLNAAIGEEQAMTDPARAKCYLCDREFAAPLGPVGADNSVPITSPSKPPVCPRCEWEFGGSIIAGLLNRRSI